MNNINWDDNLVKASDLILYARCLKDEGKLLFASLVACKAFEVLLPSDSDLKKIGKVKFVDNREVSLSFSERGEIAVNNIWKGSDINAAKKLFFGNKAGKIIRNPYNNRFQMHLMRNRIVHDHTTASEKSFKEDALELIDRLCRLPGLHSTFKKNNKIKVDNSNNYEIRRFLERKLGVINRSISTLPAKEFTLAHFENLINAEKELFPELTKELISEFNEFDFLRTDLTQVSVTDSTSAYVWLTIPLKIEEAPDEYKKSIKKFIPSLSIVMTPLELWSYIEMAGLSFHYKVKYYDYLLNDEGFIRLIHNMHEQEESNNTLPRAACLRDVHWYVFENKRTDISNAVKNIEGYRQSIRQTLLKRENDFKNAVNDFQPITWNIALPGWVDGYKSILDQSMTVKGYASLTAERIKTMQQLVDLFQEARTVWPNHKKYKKRVLQDYRDIIR